MLIYYNFSKYQHIDLPKYFYFNYMYKTPFVNFNISCKENKTKNIKTKTYNNLLDYHNSALINNLIYIIFSLFKKNLKKKLYFYGKLKYFVHTYNKNITLPIQNDNLKLNPEFIFNKNTPIINYLQHLYKKNNINYIINIYGKPYKIIQFTGKHYNFYNNTKNYSFTRTMKISINIMNYKLYLKYNIFQNEIFKEYFMSTYILNLDYEHINFVFLDKIFNNEYFNNLNSKYLKFIQFIKNIIAYFFDFILKSQYYSTEFQKIVLLYCIGN